jgi:L-fuconolactonase
MRGIGALREFGLTYDILIYARQLPATIELVDAFPDQRFVIDHAAKPDIRGGELAMWSRHIRAIARAPNVCCKLSGLVTR